MFLPPPPGRVQRLKASVYLKALDSAFEEHEEGGVWINGLSFLKDGLGFLQAPLGVGAIQSKEGLHYCVVPQEGQAERSTETVWSRKACLDLMTFKSQRFSFNQLWKK